MAKKVLFLTALLLLTLAPSAGNDREVTMELKGMTCQSCAKAIRESLLEVPGVKQAEVDWKKGTGRLKIDGNANVTDSQLQSAVEKAGYNAGKIHWKK